MLTEKRIRRPLTSDEVNAISLEIQILLEESAYSAVDDEPIEFAKKLLSKLNDIVLPNIFRAVDLRFDYRTHRTLWAFGQVWKLWQATSAHPDYDGRLVHRTATIRVGDHQDIVEDLIFNSGLQTTEENSLFKLFQAYQKLKDTYVPAWTLRAVFCFDNTCQDSVFDMLMEAHYTDSCEYEVQLESHYQKGQHDRPTGTSVWFVSFESNHDRQFFPTPNGTVLPGVLLSPRTRHVCGGSQLGTFRYLRPATGSALPGAIVPVLSTPRFVFERDIRLTNPATATQRVGISS